MKSFFTKFLIFNTLYFLFSVSLFSQNGILTGTIQDAVTKDPLIGATIKIGEAGAVTNYEGKFELQIEAGEHIAAFNYLGYEEKSEKVNILANQTLSLNILLNVKTTLLQTATVTSGKYEKPLSEVTVSMEVIKPKLIESVNSTSIDEVLEKVPGVNIIDGQANIRGGSGWSYGAGSRVILLVDDIPAMQADAGFPNWDDIAVENTNQLEVVKGAASALYGSSALNGIINVRTAFAKNQPETHISTFYTQYLDPKDKEKIWYEKQPFLTGLSVSHRRKIKKVDLVLSGFGLYEDEFREDNYKRYGRITVGTRYRITDKLSVGFNSNFNKGKTQSYFYWKGWGPDALRGDTSTFTNTDRFRFTIDPYLTYYDKSNNRHKIITRYHYIDNNNNDNQSNSSRLYYGEYQFQRRFEDLKLVTTAGVVVINSGVQAELYGDTTYTTTNLAGYLQVDRKFWNRLNISAGARFEQNTINSPAIVNGDTIPDGKTTEGKPVFRIGLNYQVGKLIFLRASFGQGYRFPTIAEKFIHTVAGGINIIPNPDLQSETGWSSEIGIKKGFKIKGWEAYVDVAGFWSQYVDMMEFAPEDRGPLPSRGLQSQNIGDTDIKGIEISVAGEGRLFGTTTSLLAGYTFIDPKFQTFTEKDSLNSSSDKNILKYRNQHSVKFDLETKISKFSIGVAAFYNSHMEAIDKLFEFFIPGLIEQRMEDMDGYLTFDARIAYQINKNIKVALIGKNIFNEEYTVRPGLLEAPTNVTCRLDFKF